ncbi:MAG: MATE family efflux transporter [Oscillospiraceae bacterium]|nr:MATE family efflux transporter [Oscillospiraceae bacterium]
MATENKLGVMPIGKLIWNMSLPIIASMLVQALYNIVDSMFVSRISQDALTAVSLAFPAQQLMIGLATGTAVGVNALMGRALGAMEQRRADDVAVNGVFLALVGAALSAVLGLGFGPALFAYQTGVQHIAQMGNEYLQVISGLSVFLFGQVMFERLLQGTGRTVYSMYTQGLGAIINIILDPIFIFTLGMGVRGAAIATVIGQCCGMVLAIYFNLTKNHDIRLRFRGFRPNWRIIGGIYAIGLPSVIMMAIGSLMTFLMNKILITYHAAHETAATAYGIFFKINSFVFMPVFGLNNGVVPIVAYNYGAQNRRRVTETIRRSVTYASAIMLLGMAIFLAVPQLLLQIFAAGPELMAVGVPCLRIVSLSFSFAGACIALGSAMQALGKSIYSMITSIVRQLVVLIPAAYLLARYGAAVGNSDLVWWSYPIAEVSSLAVTVIFYVHVYRTLISGISDGNAGETI